MQTSIIEQKTRQKIQKITYQTFLQTYNNVHAEWINGKVITLMTASDRHQNLVDWLIAILRPFIETYSLGWLRSAPFNMHLPHLKRGREPDILFVKQNRRHIVQTANLSDAADLVIEIVSPESTTRDWHDKLKEYQMGGVEEYWLIDPQQEKANFYTLTPSGQYQKIALTEDNIFYSLVLPNFWFKVSWLWQQPLPKVLDMLQNLKLL